MTYLIQTEEYGTLRKADDCIADARKWAKQALGVGPRNVSREVTYRRCDWCGASRSLCDCQPPRWRNR
jgi:hypothetical protein